MPTFLLVIQNLNYIIFDLIKSELNIVECCLHMSSKQQCLLHPELEQDNGSEEKYIKSNRIQQT